MPIQIDKRLAPFVRKHQQGFTLAIRVQPQARKLGPLAVVGTELKWGVAAAPREGQANSELCQAVAKYLGVSQRKVQLIKGETTRAKVLLITSK